MKEKRGIISVPVVASCKDCMFAKQTSSDKTNYCELLHQIIHISGDARKLEECPIVELPEQRQIELHQSGIVAPDSALLQLAKLNYANGWNDFRSKIITAATINSDTGDHSVFTQEVKDNFAVKETEKAVTKVHKRSFNKAISHLKQYIAENQSALVPQGYVCQDGYKLGAWVKKIRGIYHGSKNVSGVLTKDDIRKLDKLGMVWDVLEYQWQDGFNHAKKYYEMYHTLSIQRWYVDPDDGYDVGMWMHRQRYGKNSAEHEQQLNELCPEWKDAVSSADQEILAKNSIGIVDHEEKALATDGITKSLPSKIEEIAQQNSEITEITGDLRVLRWGEGYAQAKQYYSLCGNLVISTEYVTKSGFPLGEWLHRRRLEHDAGKLSSRKKMLLDSIGMIWNEQFATSLHFEVAASLNEAQSNNFDIPVIDKNMKEASSFSNEYSKAYSAKRWHLGYEHAKKYYLQNKNLLVPTHFICEDGYRLGSWIQNQRQARRSLVRGVSRTGKKNPAKITQERISLLDDLKMQW